jgi:hypothetical protein
VERKNTNKPETIQAFIERYKAANKKYSIQPEDRYNFDETGFRISVGRAQDILTRDKDKRAFLVDPDNRKSITSIECICGDGSSIPPFIILAGKIHMEKNFVDNMHGDTAIALSDIGYSNDDISLTWLEHFNLHTRNKRHGVWRMLISDGYGSHLFDDWIYYCWKNQIIPLCLPPHTTHLL